MAKKKKVSKHGFSFFRPSQSSDPIDSILGAAGNIIVNNGLDRLSRDVARILGLTGISPEDKIKQAREQLSLKREEVNINREELANRKRSKLLDLEVEEKELHLQRAKQQLENAETQKAEQFLQTRIEPISGALEVVADSEGLSTMVERIEAYHEWLDSMKEGNVSLILGKRGSGKTALMAKIAEYLMAVYGMPTYWVGAPATAQQFVPHWIKLVDTPDHCPANSFVMCDEAGINYLSLLFNTTENRFIRRLIMVARQKRISLAFAAQSSRDVDWAIVRQTDSLIFKEPGLHQPDSERLDIKPKAKKAALAFKKISKEDRIGVAYVFNDNFEGMIKSNVPSFWTEELSHIYSNLDLSRIENGARSKERLQTPIDSEHNILSSASLEQEILELSHQGNGIEKISKLLRCTTWTVRKCLDKNR
jgi:hypothetical protein